MNQPLTPHFSRKVLLLSLIFLLANLGIYALKNLAQPSTLPSVAPVLRSATIEDIEVKTAYDPEFRAAQKAQQVDSGTTIKTGEAEFAELMLGKNIIKLDELTEVELVKNNLTGQASYSPQSPRLVFALKSGSLWVSSFDLLEIQTERSRAFFHHTVGIVTYSQPINRLMVVTGDADLSLLDENGNVLNEFTVPLYNQVTFIDQQITENYAALKSSKLKKELKMTPIADAILEDEWVARNADQFTQEKKELQKKYIQSSVAYYLKRGFQEGAEWLTFVPEAKRNLTLKKAQTMLGYLLGGVQKEKKINAAKAIIENFDALLSQHKSDPLFENLIVETLFEIEGAEFGSPAYMLKEYLIDQVEENEGTYVYRVYLTDLRQMLHESKFQIAESILKKWLERWTDTRIKNESSEFGKQAQLLNHMILSYIEVVPIEVLNIFDQTGEKRIAFEEDAAETKFEVTQDRLQIAASLVSVYRYTLAKQYLKNSYLTLNIEAENPDLPSTKIFLENGRLLAQRIEYAEDVLHGAAQPIDETQFREYFQAKTRDVGFTTDLRKFFELDQEEIITASIVEAPTASEIATRFLEARINVSVTDISLIQGAGFVYHIQDARLMERGLEGQTLSFNATYDYKSNSVTNVVAGDRAYAGSFTLPDLILLLKKGESLSEGLYAPSIDETGIDLLITDEERLVALEGQLVAQDVARQLAFNKLKEVGVDIPEVKFNIAITDTLNLDKFSIKNALIKRLDGSGTITIHFDYNATLEEVTNVRSGEGVLLLEKVAVKDLALEAYEKVMELEKELQVIGDFKIFAKQNELSIETEDILYTQDGLLSLQNLEFLPLKLKVSGLYDPETKKFLTVSHHLLSQEDIEVKDYFDALAKTYLIAYFSENGLTIAVNQIVSDYPFKQIKVAGVLLEGYSFDFELDFEAGTLLNVKKEGAETVSAMSFEELLALPKQIKAQESPPEPEETPAEETEEEAEASPVPSEATEN